MFDSNKLSFYFIYIIELYESFESKPISFFDSYLKIQQNF